MRSDEVTTTINCEDPHRARSFLQFLRRLDLKKIEVVNAWEAWEGLLANVSITKTNEPFLGEPLRLEMLANVENGHGGIRQLNRRELIAEINVDAQRAWLGPGTFPCRNAQCGLCAFTGRSSRIVLIRGATNLQTIDINIRTTCQTRNGVYIVNCIQCPNEAPPTYAIKIGETGRKLLNRVTPIRNHSDTYPNNAAVRLQDRVDAIFATPGWEDPDEILCDIHVHINFIHPDQYRVSILEIIPHVRQRKRREKILMVNYGGCNYLDRGTGGLNGVEA